MSDRDRADLRNLSDEQFEQLLRGLRPGVPSGPPADLRARCLEVPAPGELRSELNAELNREVLTMRRRRMFGRGLGLAAAAAVVIAVVVGWPGSGRTAAAEALEAALAALDEITAVHVTTTVDLGAETEPLGTSQMWAARELGLRFEDEQMVEVLDAVGGRRSTLDRSTMTVEVTKLEDRMLVRELLARADAERNVQALHALTLRDDGAVTEQTALRSGRRVQRLEGLDDRGHSIVVELEPRTRRMLLTQTWTYATEQSRPLRVTSRYDYPDPATLDRSLFAAVPDDAVEVIEPSVMEQARMRCMVRLRDLTVMAIRYADEHDGKLPARVEELAPYADGRLETCLACALPGRDEPLAVTSLLEKLEPGHAPTADDVLFECRFPDGKVIRAFGDGHVEVD